MRSDSILKLLRAAVSAEDLHGHECGWKYYELAFDKGPMYFPKPGWVAYKGNSAELTLNTSMGQIKFEYDSEGEVGFWFPSSIRDQVKQSLVKCLQNSKRHAGRDWNNVWDDAQEDGLGIKAEEGMTFMPWDAWSFGPWLIEQIEAGATLGEYGYCTDKHAEWMLNRDPIEHKFPWDFE